MKFPSLCCSLCVLLATAIAFIAISTQAETRCPGNIVTIRPRLVANALLVIPVKINQSGPFDFMVDTGSQLNLIDPALAHTVMELLRRINHEDGITVITSLHVLELAQAYGQRIIGLHQGRVVHDGPPASLDRAATARIFGPGVTGGAT